ncbi:MAG: GNAT family N-acetyltransferase [Bacilli bacterium]|jgi:RimJ/RimL family protein N-acetyltransferase|nr:GNAT family N-acetyltransferase [Bacilli bacterium]
MSKMIETRIDDFYLKETTKDDTSIILKFIKDLAEYEKMLDEVEATEELINESIFNNKYATILLCMYQNEVIGYVVYFYNFSTFTGKGTLYLEDVIIDDKYRHKGFGTEIFYQLARIAKEKDLSRIEWVCLDWNEPSMRFYEDVIKGKPQKEWIRYRLDQDGIDNLFNNRDK